MCFPKTKTIFKVFVALLIVYIITFSIGVYRVSSFTEKLSMKHDRLGEEVERLVSTIQVGQPIGERDGSLMIQQEDAPNEYVIWYYNFIEESSSVSNRGGPVYHISVTDGVITDIRKSSAISHGDRFTSSFYFYPLVGVLGFDATEDH